MPTATVNRAGVPGVGQRRLRRRVLNVRLLVRSLVMAAMLAPAAYFWHAFQVDRKATVLLDRAGEMEKSEDWLGAAQSIHRFLKLRPDDVAAKIRLAEDFDHAAATAREKSRAAEYYATAIGLAPERTDLRDRHLVLLFESGDFSAALRFAEEMLEVEPDGALAQRVRALALLAQMRNRGNVAAEEVAASLEAAIVRNPDDVGLAANLAHLYRVDLQLSDKAEETINLLVERAADKSAALLARYSYLNQFKLPGADKDLDQALSLDADAKDLGIRLAAAYRAQQAADWDAAEQYFKDVVRIDERDRRGYFGLGLAYSEQGKVKEGLDAWRTYLSKVSNSDLVILIQVAKAEIQLQKWNDAEKTLRRIEQQAEKIFEREQSTWRVALDSLRAEMLIARDQCEKAIPLLKEAILLRQAGAETEDSIAGNATLYAALGQCHARLTQWDQAATTYQKAADLRPSEMDYRMSAAAAWASAGRWDEASRQYDKALSGGRGPASAWVSYAQAAFRQQLISLAPNWPDFERILAEAQAKIGEVDAKPAEKLSLKLLDVEFLLHQEKFDEAFALLKAIEADVAMVPELAARLIFDYERTGRRSDADRVLSEFEKEPQNRLQSVYLWTSVLANRKQFDEAERRLSDALADQLTDEQRTGLQYRRAILDLEQGETDAAKLKLERLSEAAPGDRRVPALLVELALSRDDLLEAEKWERRLRTLLGEESAQWRYYRAQRLVHQLAKPSSDDSKDKQQLLAEAAKMQAEVERLRPNWGSGYLLKARLALLGRQPDAEAAIRSYIQAIQLGESRIQVYQSLIALLYQQNRIGEAASYLNRLEDSSELPSELTMMAMDIDARQGNLSQAIESARRQVEEHPDDAMRRVWLGQLLSRISPASEGGNFSESEAQLKRARELAPKDLRTWLALLSLYKNRNQIDAARKLLVEFENSDAIAEKERAFVLAQGFAFLGDQDLAKSLYVDAVKTNTDSVDVQLQAARFFLGAGADTELAKQCVHRVLQLEPNHDGARSLDAWLKFGEAESEDELERIYASLDRTDGASEPDQASQRLKALMMIRRGGQDSRRRALEAVEALVDAESKPTDIDRLLLARLYEAQGQTAAAGEQWRALANRDNASANHLAAYVDFLLRTDQATEATYSLDQLAKVEPETENWRTTTLRARWFKARGETPKIAALVQGFLKQALAKANVPAPQSNLWLSAAKLYSSLALGSEAEASYRQAFELEPRTLPALAVWLAKHGKVSEAAILCIKAAKADPSAQSARTLSSVLLLGPLPGELRTEAESLLAMAVERHADNAQLLFDVASERIFHGNNAEAVRLLRRCLQLDPKNIQAMNNLAILLARGPQNYGEAIQYIDRAISLAGLQPELLDSKGWILICHGDGAGAEALLRDAVSVPPGDARHHFHLALACQMQGKLDAARKSFERASDLELQANMLMPDELSRLHSLEQALR